MNGDEDPMPQLLHYEDEEIAGVGIPSGHHPVTDPQQLDNDPARQQYIAQLLARFDAPQESLDLIFNWVGVDLDDDQTLWIYYRKKENENPESNP